MSNIEEVFQRQQAEITGVYARSELAQLVDFVRDNPQFRSGPNGETLHLAANRVFSHLDREDGPVPIMKIDLTASFKSAGTEQKANLSIAIAGNKEFSVSSSGFTGTSSGDFKRVDAISSRFDTWLKAIEAKTGIGDFISKIHDKAGYSASKHPRTPEKARYEGQSPA